MSGCDCFKVGGPFISEDPDCPAHGSAATNEMAALRADLAKAQAEVEQLRARLDRSVCLDSEGERIHFGARVVCGQCFDSQGQHLKNLKAEVAELRAQQAFDAAGFEMVCLDCGADADDYWIHHELWASHAPEAKEREAEGLRTLICSTCFQTRMGRGFRAADFIPNVFTAREIAVYERAEAVEALVSEQVEKGRRLEAQLADAEKVVEAVRVVDGGMYPAVRDTLAAYDSKWRAGK